MMINGFNVLFSHLEGRKTSIKKRKTSMTVSAAMLFFIRTKYPCDELTPRRAIRHQFSEEHNQFKNGQIPRINEVGFARSFYAH